MSQTKPVPRTAHSNPETVWETPAAQPKATERPVPAAPVKTPISAPTEAQRAGKTLAQWAACIRSRAQ